MNLRTGEMGGYPNRCRIVRRERETSFSEGEERVLYEGECVMFGSGQMRKFTLGSVVKADFCVEVPLVLTDNGNENDPRLKIGSMVKPGDIISVEGRCKDADVVLSAPDEVFRMGTTIYFNVSMN